MNVLGLEVGDDLPDYAVPVAVVLVIEVITEESRGILIRASDMTTWAQAALLQSAANSAWVDVEHGWETD